MSPKDFSIKIGWKNLNLDMIPEEGLKLSNLSESTRKALSIFDTDSKKGILSKQEMKNAILFFQQQDKKYTEDCGDIIKIHKKDGKLDGNEIAATNKIIQAKVGDKNASIHGELPEEIEDGVKKQNAKKKQNLQDTTHTGWAKDGKGGWYRWDSDAGKFCFVAKNVSKINPDGSYETSVKNKKGQKIKQSFDENSQPKTLKVLNSENKVYAKPAYAAKVAGLKQVKEYEDISDPIRTIMITVATSGANLVVDAIKDENPKDNAKILNQYINTKSGIVYEWNEKKHQFNAIGKIDPQKLPQEQNKSQYIYKRIYDYSSIGGAMSKYSYDGSAGFYIEDRTTGTIYD